MNIDYYMFDYKWFCSYIINILYEKSNVCACVYVVAKTLPTVHTACSTSLRMRATDTFCWLKHERQVWGAACGIKCTGNNYGVTRVFAAAGLHVS